MVSTEEMQTHTVHSIYGIFWINYKQNTQILISKIQFSFVSM